MIRVSFTKFLDFVAQTGEPKATTALQAWRQSNTPYDPTRDYHKRVRELIVDFSKTKIEPNWEAFVDAQNPKKQKNFSETIERFRTWRKAYKSIAWFDPPRSEWKTEEFFVAVNPELGLELDGQRHAIKLFLNNNPLSKLKAQSGGLIMHSCLHQVARDTKFSVLDIKAGKFHTFGKATEKLEYLLVGERAHLSAMLSAIRSKP